MSEYIMVRADELVNGDIITYAEDYAIVINTTHVKRNNKWRVLIELVDKNLHISKIEISGSVIFPRNDQAS